MTMNESATNHGLETQISELLDQIIVYDHKFLKEAREGQRDERAELARTQGAALGRAGSPEQSVRAGEAIPGTAARGASGSRDPRSRDSPNSTAAGSCRVFRMVCSR